MNYKAGHQKRPTMNYMEFIFKSFWHFCGSAFLLYLVLYFAVNGGIKIFSRMLRTINVLSRGWPPPHLDADGDWKDAGRTEVNPIES